MTPILLLLAAVLLVAFGGLMAAIDPAGRAAVVRGLASLAVATAGSGGTEEQARLAFIQVLRAHGTADPALVAAAAAAVADLAPSDDAVGSAPDEGLSPAETRRVREALGIASTEDQLAAVGNPGGLEEDPGTRPGNPQAQQSTRASLGLNLQVLTPEIARQIGHPQAVRAVGAANGRNPVCLVVPCHRVVGADGSLTGYAGGLARKRFLLDLERAQPGADGQLALPG